MRFTVLVAVIAFVFPAAASEPGQPLDCSDWVFLEPGLNCVTEIPYPCKDAAGEERVACSLGGDNMDSAAPGFVNSHFSATMRWEVRKHGEEATVL